MAIPKSLTATPLKFIDNFVGREGIYRGCNRIPEFKGRSDLVIEDPESWELSVNPVSQSLLSIGDGEVVGFKELVNQYPQEILGKAVAKKCRKRFPLLFKFLDVGGDIPSHVHPDDKYARKRYRDPWGKNEAWVVLDIDPAQSPKLYVGLRDDLSGEELSVLTESTDPYEIRDLLNPVDVEPGDVIYIPAGTIHALGRGLFIYEVQQDSDRNLFWHMGDIEETFEVIDFKQARGEKLLQDLKKSPGVLRNGKDGKELVLLSEKGCPYFAIHKLIIEDMNMMTEETDNRFQVLTVVNGKGILHLSFSPYGIEIKKGETVFVPAIIGQYLIEAQSNTLEIIKTHVPL